MKKTFALLLAVVMVLSVLAGCGPQGNTETTSGTQGTQAPTPSGTEGTEGTTEPTLGTLTGEAGHYTYYDYTATLSASWNPHTYQTTDQAYPLDYTSSGLYSFIFNDANHPIEGKDPFTGYVIVPEMAAEMAVDVTEQVRAEHPEFGIPEGETEGYAYSVKLREDLTFDDGTPITAQTFVEGMKRLLDPRFQNYRAADVYDSSNTAPIVGSEDYFKQGHQYYEDNGSLKIPMDALAPGEDGQYVVTDAVTGANAMYQGCKVYIAVDVPITWTGGEDTLADYVEAYGDAYFGMDNWDTLLGLADEDGVVPCTEENLALLSSVTTTNPNWGETDADLFNYLLIDYTYPDGVDYDATVGYYAASDYELVSVFTKYVVGFDVYYGGLQDTLVLVDPAKYDACLVESTGADGNTIYSSTYNTNVDTAVSYGPYKVDGYQTDKSIHFTKNENWYGWKDGNHTYVDPEDGQTYDMYQTTDIDCQVVTEAATRLNMFLAGQLSAYGLTSDDFEQYRNSEYTYASPGSTIFFFILNGYLDTLQEREAAADFDQTTTDLETMTLKNFRKAFAVSFDKNLFIATTSPSYTPGFGILGDTYIYDPDTSAFYRDTDAAKQVLCDFYSVDPADYASLDEAVDSITGYDPVAAKELYAQAFQDALDAGYITDNDGDGVSDQTVTLTYSISTSTDIQTKRINYLNEKLKEITEGTPFDGKIVIVESAPCGDEWSNNIRNGVHDVVLGGWNGSLLNPFSLMTAYVNPDNAYDANWFKPDNYPVTINIDGEDVTMSLSKWVAAINGGVEDDNGVIRSYGNDDLDTRVYILAQIEGAILQTYDYIPMINDGSYAMLSQKHYYVTDEYNPVLARGGITYMKYNYDDAEWVDYIASQGGVLQY